MLPDSRPVSENSFPCPHPISCCLQGRAASVSPQARILSPSSPHLSLLTLSLLTPLCPRMRASRTLQAFLLGAGPPEPGPAPVSQIPTPGSATFRKLPRWGPPLCRGWAHSGLDLHPMGSEPHSSGHGNPYCGSKAPLCPRLPPPRPLEPLTRTPCPLPSRPLTLTLALAQAVPSAPSTLPLQASAWLMLHVFPTTRTTTMCVCVWGVGGGACYTSLTELIRLSLCFLFAGASLLPSGLNCSFSVGRCCEHPSVVPADTRQ